MKRISVLVLILISSRFSQALYLKNGYQVTGSNNLIDLYIEPILGSEGVQACRSSQNDQSFEPCIRLVVPRPEGPKDPSTNAYEPLPFGGLMFLPEGTGVLQARNISTAQLTQEQISEGATKSFYLYRYDWSNGGCQQHIADNTCTYTDNIDSSINFAVQISYVLAITYIDSGVYSSCGPVILLDNAGGSGAATGGTDLSTTPRQFSFSGNAKTINCVLGFLMFETTRTISSDTFIRIYGALPSITVTIGPLAGEVLPYAIQATVYLVVQTIDSPPVMQTCMTLEGVPSRSALSSDTKCLTPPISTYGAAQGTACQTGFFAPDGRNEYICTSCGTTQSDYYYVLEDSDMTWANPTIAFPDQAGQGSARIDGVRIRLDAGSLTDPLQPSIVGHLLDSPPWTFCAQSAVTDGGATRAADAVGGAQVPADFARYSLRVVNATTSAALCEPATYECAAACHDAEGPLKNLCACATAVCAALNPNDYASTSRPLAQSDPSVYPNRLWFEVFAVAAPAAVLERGYMDLAAAVAASGALVTGTLYVLPSPAGPAGSLGWYKIGPLQVTATARALQKTATTLI